MGSLKRVAVLCGFTLLLAATAQAEDWQVAKDEDGIKVSLSEIAGSKYKAYRGVTVIKAPLAKVQALQEDVAGACAWIHECKSQKLVDKKGDEAWTYTQFKAPFPVTDRDSYIHVTPPKPLTAPSRANWKVCRPTSEKQKATCGSPRWRVSGNWCQRAITRPKSPTRYTPSQAAACRRGWPTSLWWTRRSTP